MAFIFTIENAREVYVTGISRTENDTRQFARQTLSLEKILKQRLEAAISTKVQSLPTEAKTPAVPVRVRNSETLDRTRMNQSIEIHREYYSYSCSICF